ncbi:unnamed protein product [Ranitomeya imitator]|uniref:Uncharacterized protein n=1 Tax=Ranitomeya imitator TaxID=111125 RepID=A0ABN9LDV2_9NEOB|nr:unnamed protein product [Ranitomeya imitator]
MNVTKTCILHVLGYLFLYWWEAPLGGACSQWCAECWDQSWIDVGITRNLVLLELFPVIVSIEIWGDFFKNKRIILNTDNKGDYAVNCLSSECSSSESIKILVLCRFKAKIWLKARHLPGSRNLIAGSLSHCQMDRFRILVPMMDEKGLDCPKHLWNYYGNMELASRYLQQSVAVKKWESYCNAWNCRSHFCKDDSSPLTRFQFSSVLRRSLNFLGLDDFKISSHSFRIGEATEAVSLKGTCHPENRGAKYACTGAVAEDQKRTSWNEDGRRRSGPETPIRPDQQRDRPWFTRK